MQSNRTDVCYATSNEIEWYRDLKPALCSRCGQKGPLYLPGDPSAVKTDIPAQPAGEQESNEEEDGET